MAYNLCDRFPRSEKYYTLLDPGVYQYEESSKNKPNKIPFLSNTPRNTQVGIKIWTHRIYDPDKPPRIPNCTSMMSNLPRFSYEAFNNEDFGAVLCMCGIENTCECSNEEEATNNTINCQCKVSKRLYIGPTPRSAQGDGLSCPSKRDRGFKILPDGSRKRLWNKVSDECPPFYDARVNESTAFYKGWKWSRWTSKRAIKSPESRPGPADYSILHNPSPEEICAEKVRHHKRKTSKQLRYIELILQRNVLEGHPGPASYCPTLPKGTALTYLGPKAIRFAVSGNENTPAPTDYWIRRDFDPPEPSTFPCHAKLPEPACFGTKAQRFKPRLEQGPSPATYRSAYKPCSFQQCSQAPFGCSTERFTENPSNDYHLNKIKNSNEKFQNNKESKFVEKVCTNPTWEFKSKTIRMKQLKKKLNEPSPADLPQTSTNVTRSNQIQHQAPFFSSEGRFQPWNDWMPVHGKLQTPGPCYYDVKNPPCAPAVHRGPLQRSPRFATAAYHMPAPNKYKIGGGVETILSTHNQRLKSNLVKQHTFHWRRPKIAKKLNFEEQEAQLFQRSMMLLDNNCYQEPIIPPKKTVLKDTKKSKLLRYFLYNHQVPYYF